MSTPHLDEEALSAAVDDAGTAEEQAHLAGCASCQAGVAQLATVAQDIATPVGPRPGAETDAAIDRALSEWGGSAGERPGDAAAGPGWEAASFSTLRRPTRRGPPRWVTTVAGVAAAVVVVGGLVAIMRTAGMTAGHSSTVAGPTAQGARAANGSESTLAAGPGSTDRLDLGDQFDPGALGRTVRGLLPPSGSAASQSPPIGPGPARDAANASPCADQARVAAGPVAATQAPNLVASLRWRGQAAFVLVYPSPAGGLTGVVMRAGDCAVLTRLTP